MQLKKVQILLSVYKPNETYLRKQLKSLNMQDYPNIEILVFDDAASIAKTDPKIFQEELTEVAYRILPYKEKNIGYAKAFETLVEFSDADFLAFCDQDDIWRSDKISKSVQELEKTGALLVASDRTLIDGEDRIFCESVRKVNNKNYERWQTGDDICKYNLIITFAVGMCLVVNGRFARKCLPFSSNTGHDKWLLSCASAEGKVAFINDTLVQYRRHGKNVSGVLVGIDTKEEYINRRVKSLKCVVNDFFTKYPNHKDREEMESFVDARMNHKFFKLLKHYYLAPDVVKFELVLCLIPDNLFGWLIKLARMISQK